MALRATAPISGECYVLVSRLKNTRFRLNGKRTQVTRRFLLAGLFVCAAVSTASAQFAPAPGTGPGLSETIEAIDSARVTTRILYVTAHPDDESSSVLTYLARGLHASVALLSLTRGEGGQNALGPEQAPQLGLIRTQELLAATRGYGVKLYFTRAKDFGFSKTPEETEKVWGDQVVEDMVRVIRTFRPNIVINNWGGVHGGHGHHQAAGLLTPKAVQLAADGTYLSPRTRDEAPTWGAGENSVVILDLERGNEKPTGYILPLDDVSPLWGKSWREIGIDAFANHRTQGISAFLASPFIRRPIALKREDGQVFDPQILARPLSEVLGDKQGETCAAHRDWCAAIAAANEGLLKARAEALRLEWRAATDALAETARLLSGLYKPDMASSLGPLQATQESEVREAVDRVANALWMAAGLEVTAEADRANAVIGETIGVTVGFHCRPGVHCPVKPQLGYLTGSDNAPEGTGDPESGIKYTLPITRPELPSPSERVLPEPIPVVRAVLQMVVGEGRSVNRSVAVVHTEATSTRVDRIPVRIVPAYALEVEPKQAMEVLGNYSGPFDVLLKVHSYATKAANVSVGLDVPAGWTASAPQDAAFDGVGDRYIRLKVTLPKQIAAGNYSIAAYAKRGSDKFTTSLTPLPSLPTQLWEEPAQCLVHAFAVNVPANLRVGYIAAEGEPIPDSLRMLGISVELLDAEALAFRDLSKFDSIVTGNRAYELRADLPGANQRLLDYVSGGGTLIVQYNTANSWDTHQYAPYPTKIGNPTPRITDETSPVKFLKPEDSLLNRPNKITQNDFNGWVQERGLYFWKDFDPKYTPLLGMNDPGEAELVGGLVYTKYGKGTYIYTGLAFFRQLPEGVPGAFRLFVNLLSASRQE
jgi:LmbE family N-acetylglucosaminyl deacetylase